MDKDYLILKRASASRLSGEWNDYDYDVLVDGIVVGRIMKSIAAPVETPWMWTLAFGHHEDRSPSVYSLTRRCRVLETKRKSCARPEHYRFWPLLFRTPDVQQSFLIGCGTTCFNQQRDAVPALLGAPGLT